mmetsp:Transcript_3659/g.14729  ORF Transcript_3659/g.14729 Transcript_3659/m.14729 type:complete len:299 (-) Transcript_3659:1382-2278(-)
MSAMRSTTLLEYPHSLSYQLTSLTKLGESEMPAVASKIDERSSPMKSADTTASSVYPMIPFSSPFVEASLIAVQISSYDAAFSMRTVRSTTETSCVGTRNAIPVSLPLSAGRTLPTAFAAPVDDGMMFAPAPRPPRQSFMDGPSTVFCVAVVACTVVIRPSTMPYSSSMILARGARQLVVQLALDTMSRSSVYSSLLTPMTNIGASPEGAEMTTFLAPAVMCFCAPSSEVNTPVDSTTKSTSLSPHGMFTGSRSAKTAMGLPSTMKPIGHSSAESHSTWAPYLASPANWPWTVSYLNM